MAREKMRCAFSGCKTSHLDPVKLHRFPKDVERCKMWVLATGNKYLKYVSPQKLNSDYSMCEKHFSDWCFMNLDRKERLVHNAVPCLPDKPDETSCSMKSLGSADSVCKIENTETSLKWWNSSEDNGEHSEGASSLDSDEDLKSYEKKLRGTKMIAAKQHSGDMARCIMLLKQCDPEKDSGSNRENINGSSENEAPCPKSKEGESLPSVVATKLPSEKKPSKRRKRRRCALCGIKGEENIIRRFHTFPTSTDMSDRWAKVIGKKIILQASTERRHKRYRVCSDHFSTDQYATNKRMKLHSDAVPNCNLGSLTFIDIGALRASLNARISAHSDSLENAKSLNSSVPKSSDTEESSKCNTPSQKTSSSDPCQRTVSPEIPKIRTFFFGSEKR